MNRVRARLDFGSGEPSGDRLFENSAHEINALPFALSCVEGVRLSFHLGRYTRVDCYCQIRVEHRRGANFLDCLRLCRFQPGYIEAQRPVGYSWVPGPCKVKAVEL